MHFYHSWKDFIYKKAKYKVQKYSFEFFRYFLRKLMATNHPSSIKQANEIINSINQIKKSSSIANRLSIQPKQSQISQYYNVENKSFQNSQNSHKLLESPQKNQQSFPSISTSRSRSPKQDLAFLQTQPQNFKQSRVEQSLQKAFILNRNSQRIPFKKRDSAFVELNYPEGEKRSYKFYEPQYADYYVKEERNFWAEMFEKFYEKKGSLQNMEFTNFHHKDQSKSEERFSQTNKISEIEEKNKKIPVFQKYVNTTTIFYSLIGIIILLIGFKVLFFSK